MSENAKFDAMKVIFDFNFIEEKDHIIDRYRIYADGSKHYIEHQKITSVDKKEHIETSDMEIEDIKQIEKFLKDITKAIRLWRGNYTNAASNALWYSQQGYSWRLRLNTKKVIQHFGKDHKPKNFDEVLEIIRRMFERG